MSSNQRPMSPGGVVAAKPVQGGAGPDGRSLGDEERDQAEPTTMEMKKPETYNHHSAFHRTNPFIVRAAEMVLAVCIVAVLLIVGDFPVKSTIWIHFSLASPTIAIAAMFGVAGLYHRNPLDLLFTLILLGFCLVCYVFSFIDICLRWQEIKRNRGRLPLIWVTILSLNALMILTLIVDIIWYIKFLMGCPCFIKLKEKFAGKNSPCFMKLKKKFAGKKSDAAKGKRDETMGGDVASIQTAASVQNLPK